MGSETQRVKSETLRTAPKLERDDEQSLTVRCSDKDQVRQLYGMKTNEGANLLLEMALQAFGSKAMTYMELMPAMAVEMEPQDAVEAMLVTQMTATHLAMCSMSQKSIQAGSYAVRESYERSMTRLSRTFLAQMDSLKKYRAKAQQTVRVERVNVESGGQAIVGDVSHGGEG